MSQQVIHGRCDDGCAQGCPQFLTGTEAGICAFCGHEASQHVIVFIVGPYGDVLYSNVMVVPAPQQSLPQQMMSQQSLPQQMMPQQQSQVQRHTSAEPVIYLAHGEDDYDVKQYLKERPVYKEAKSVLGYKSSKPDERSIPVLGNRPSARSGPPPARATVSMKRSSASSHACADQQGQLKKKTSGKNPPPTSVYVRYRDLLSKENHFPTSEFEKMTAIRNGTLLEGFNRVTYPDADTLFAHLLTIQFNRLGPVGFGTSPTNDFFFWRVEGGAKHGQLHPLGFGSTNYPTLAQDWDLISSLDLIVCTPDLHSATELKYFPDTRPAHIKARDEQLTLAACQEMRAQNAGTESKTDSAMKVHDVDADHLSASTSYEATSGENDNDALVDAFYGGADAGTADVGDGDDKDGEDELMDSDRKDEEEDEDEDEAGTSGKDETATANGVL
ncbi:hypothetical protein B484DRAFT_414182 [Ochromonadaceae sp. CCMP2298]|nr:hypothetical protein B484DRAFT_414182 [Ochromonadaceae sp. CCMP2298]